MLGLNQDKICESIVLVNGTIIKNPDLPPSSVSMNGPSSKLTLTTNMTAPMANQNTTITNTTAESNSGPCHNGASGFILEGHVYCKFSEYKKALDDSTTNWVEDEWCDPGEVGNGCGDGSNDNDDDEKTANCGGEACTPTEKEDSTLDEPYCDELQPESGFREQSCWDRKDYDQDTGLYPCRDGSEEKDWRDCD
jgi:hypothetical protein